MSHKRSVPFSLEDKHLDYISRKGEGKNVSEKLRSLLDKLLVTDTVIVFFIEAEIEKGNYIPAYAAQGSFLVFQKTVDSKEYGENLPFVVPRKQTDIEKAIEDAGYIAGTVTYEAQGFVSIWAAPHVIDRCGLCKKALTERIVKCLA